MGTLKAGMYSQMVSDIAMHNTYTLPLRDDRSTASISGISVTYAAALPRGHASMRTATRRLHITHMRPTQRPVTHTVTTTAHRAPTALQKPPRLCATQRHTVRGRPIGRDRTGARCSEPTAPRASWEAASVVMVGWAAAAAVIAALGVAE